MNDEEIKNKIGDRLQLLKDQKKELLDNKQIAKNELEGDPRYIEITQKIAELNQIKKAIREEIFAKFHLTEAIKDLNEEISALQEILSSDLSLYWKKSDSGDIELNGTIYHINLTAKLKETNQPSLFGKKQ